MRTVAWIVLVVSASIVSPAPATESVVVGKDVAVEEAWARANAAGPLEVFLVVNNGGADDAVLGIQVPGATDVQVVDAAGRAIELSIPIHSELYMEPDGVRIVVTGLPASSTVPVIVTVANGDPVTIQAEVLGDGQAVPDHHNYDHG